MDHDQELAFLFAFQAHCFSALPVIAELTREFGSARLIWKNLMHGCPDPRLCLSAKQLFCLKKFDAGVFLKTWRKFHQRGINAVTIFDPLYPQGLINIAQAPLVLFYRGQLGLLSAKKRLAVVGSRRMTSYGRRVLEHLIPGLVAQDYVIVSGMAMGVDGYAHELTLDNQGQTVAVQAQGLDQGYPQQNHALFERVVENGLVVSEFLTPPTWVRSDFFPRRNRIISGLSEGVLVVEAGRKSGSLITSGFALEEGKDVYVVPGEIFSTQSQGCHALLKNGAKLVTGMSDIVADFSPHVPPRKILPREFSYATRLEKKIHELCLASAKTLEEMAEAVDEPVAALLSTITMMELKGLIEDCGGKKVSVGDC